MRLVVALALAAFTLGRVGLACDEEVPRCYAGDYVACACENGAAGYASCVNNGYGSCVCDGVTPGLDAGSPGTAVAFGDAGASLCTLSRPEGGPKAYADPCTSGSECASCICELFGAAGRCSVPCSTVDTCPSPALACTTRGFCRPDS